jgi:hypothetical protein
VILRLAALLLAVSLAQAVSAQEPGESPQRVLGLIRAQFRSHRPPPPFVSYTITRAQKTNQGYPDVVDSYTYHIWCRTRDRAAMGRKVFRDNYEYPPEFMRPAFNEPRDPGPPTADVFEPAPVRPRPISEVPTPEPANDATQVIGRISTIIESDYRVTALEHEGPLLHLTIEPIRDIERNRLRQIYADAATLDVTKLVATDKLFDSGSGKGQVYGVTFTIVMGTVDGHPVVTDIHGRVGDGYAGDGVDVDFTFRDIKFPATMPDWYFNSRLYGQHSNDIPL